MRISKLAATLPAAALILGGTAVPAEAAVPPPVTWKNTTSRGGPIRECDASTCDVVVSLPAGVRVQWSTYTYNSVGNRWYSVRYTGEYEVYRGMMYCANLTAGC
ncbi:hypothetical protein SAMN05421812_101487 [Asanoa hainanensis]|uniref:SH3 domain-containing protein n=1 Tax=Asanoa hainanensis TaxID=560556 RepID=A0A239GN34_9ACTN|nr:hypothetical protein [Asanoa hainanensis]SNS70540.1 hypothetical protein SAMN05421812_101487 [Asanoa hainanensis]